MITSFVKRAIHESKVLGALDRLYVYLGKQAQQSHIIQWFLAVREDPADTQRSIFSKLFYGILGIFGTLFEKIGLSRLLEGSILKEPFLWGALAMALAPLLPTMAVLAIVMISFVALFLQLVCEKKRMTYQVLTKYVLLYAFVYLFATIFSVSLQDSLLGGILSVAFTLFFVVISQSVDSKKKADILVRALIIIGALVSVYGFYQYMHQDQFSGQWVDADMFSSITFRVYSTLENPNVLGEYFLLVLPFAASIFLTAKNKADRFVSFICGCAMLVCLVLTYSRGCYLGLLVSAAAFLVLIDRRFLLLGILGLLALPFVLPDTILNRFLSIGNMEDSSTSYRVYIWMGTLAMLKDYWFSGIGPGIGAFNKVYPFYAYHSVSAPHSHNLFLQIFCDAGVIGFMVFASIIWMFYRLGFRAVSVEKNWREKIHLIAGISAISGFMVQSLTDYTFYNYRVMLLFWAVLGLTAALAHMCMHREEGK